MNPGAVSNDVGRVHDALLERAAAVTILKVDPGS